MPFKGILKELVETTPASTGAILADWEGEAVEQHCLYDDFELKVLGAHLGIILAQMKEVHAEFPAGELRDAVITSLNQHLIVGEIGPDYSLVMTLSRGAVVGQALYRFRKAAERLQKEIY